MRPGVEVRLEEKLVGFTSNDDGEIESVITDKGPIAADVVVMGLGVKPNARLAEQAGIALGAGGAIHVNQRMETSAPNVWAAGDCAESLHRISGRQVAIALGTIANKHGVVAGTNISGGNAMFPGVLGTAITKFNELEIARTGLSEREARELGMDVNTAMIKSRTRSGYYPGSDRITVKLTADADTGRLLGGQIVGMPGSGQTHRYRSHGDHGQPHRPRPRLCRPIVRPAIFPRLGPGTNGRPTAVEVGGATLAASQTDG